MKISVFNRFEVDPTYRVSRALGLFNISSDFAAEFSFDVEVPVTEEGLAEGDWRIGVVCGPSGSGKTSIGRKLTELGWLEWGTEPWGDPRTPIIDAIDPEGSFDEVTGILASVGLGTVPSWLRPFGVLSNGEKYRAELARLLAEKHRDRVWFDEFTSVLDRKVATVGAMAFAKAWRREAEPRQVVFLTPHHDVLPALQPDWVIYTSLQEAAGPDPALLTPGRADFEDKPVVGTLRT